MAAPPVDPDDAARQARQQMEADVDTRVNAVRTVAEAARQADDAEQAARDANTAHSDAWNAALATGWKEKDLRAIGVRSPTPGSPTGRRRRGTPPGGGGTPPSAA